MSKFHVNPSGEVNLCTAQPGNCPLSPDSQHFGTAEEARAFFEQSNDIGLQGIQAQLREGYAHFEKGSIFIDAPSTDFQEYYDYLRGKISATDFERVLRSKEERDENSFHITVVNYKDLKKIKKESGSLPELPREPFSYRLLGVGSAQNEVSRAFYCLVSSPSIQEFRSKLGLEPADLHITLGFLGEKDVYNRTKGTDTLI